MLTMLTYFVSITCFQSRLAVMNMVDFTPEYAYTVQQKLLDEKLGLQLERHRISEDAHERWVASGIPAFESIRRTSSAQGSSIIRELAFVSASGGTNPSARVEDLFVTTTQWTARMIGTVDSRLLPAEDFDAMSCTTLQASNTLEGQPRTNLAAKCLWRPTKQNTASALESSTPCRFKED